MPEWLIVALGIYIDDCTPLKDEFQLYWKFDPIKIELIGFDNINYKEVEEIVEIMKCNHVSYFE